MNIYVIILFFFEFYLYRKQKIKYRRTQAEFKDLETKRK